jgi:hypothetical protein
LNWIAFRYVFPFVSVTVNISLAVPARMDTAIQLLAVLFEGNVSAEEEVVPASLLVCCIKVIEVPPPEVDVTVSVSEAPAIAPVESFTVTICVKVPACDGVPESTPVALNVKPSAPVPDQV